MADQVGGAPRPSRVSVRVAVCVALLALSLSALFGDDREERCPSPSPSRDAAPLTTPRAQWPAIVLGATGETGRKLVAQLAADEACSGVTAVVRRELSAEELAERFGEPAAARVVQHVVDYERVAERAESVVPAGGLPDGARAFCMLGTTRSKAGSAEAFRRVDYDYVLESARQLREAGSPHLTLMSSQGAKASSSLLYPRTKGEVEAAVAGLGFPRVSVFRPGLLLTDRKETRSAEWVLQKVWPNWALPACFMAPRTDQVAAAMLLNAKGAPKESPVEIYENAEIVKCRVGPPPAAAAEAAQ